MSTWLAFDASTQSLSAILVDDSGQVTAEESVNFGLDLPDYNAPKGFVQNTAEGEVVSDPLMWLDALDLCLERMCSNGVDFSGVRGISGAGQQHGTVYLSDLWFTKIKALDPSQALSNQIKPCLARDVAPIWMDVSTGDECREISRSMGGDLRVCETSGSIPIERFSGPQIRKFSKDHKASYAKTARIHLVSSFLASILSGSDAPIDHGDAAGMNLMNLDSFEWDPGLVEATAPDLNSKLPSIEASSTSLGTVSLYFQKRYGFHSNAEVIAFTGDNPSSLIGMGAGEPGTLVISLGTSDTLFAAMTKPTTDPNGYGHVFGNPSGGFMSLVCFRNGSLARERVKEHLGVDWNAFDAEHLQATPLGNDGDGMIPFFGPEISPRIDLQKPILFGSPEFVQTPPAAKYIRACLEGQFINMKLQTQWMELTPKQILLTGGASTNDGIAQTVADVFGLPVERLSSTNSVALGGILRAAQALGGDAGTLKEILCAPVAGSRRKPDESASDAYQRLACSFSETLRSLQDE